jgi:hypothetical protein
VKNQYFGDRNDLYKYDLVLELMEHVPGLSQFVYVAMLTPRDGRRDGRFTDYPAGGRSEELWAWLNERVSWGERDVTYLAGLFERKPYGYRPFTQHFTDEGRGEYFARLPEADLRRSVILLDPDNGLETRAMRRGLRAKYVLMAEVRDVYERMGPSSLLVVYQHLPRKERQAFFAETARRLRREAGVLGCACVCPDNQVSFFVLSKAARRSREVAQALTKYGGRVRMAHCCPALLPA